MQDGGRAVSMQPLSESAVSLLLLLGFHAYHDAQLLTQLARIFRHMTLSNTILFASPATVKEAYERAGMVSQSLTTAYSPHQIDVVRPSTVGDHESREPRAVLPSGYKNCQIDAP